MKRASAVRLKRMRPVGHRGELLGGWSQLPPIDPRSIPTDQRLDGPIHAATQNMLRVNPTAHAAAAPAHAHFPPRLAARRQCMGRVYAPEPEGRPPVAQGGASRRAEPWVNGR